MLEKLNTKNSIIRREIALAYDSTAHIPNISLCNIPCSINVTIKRMPTIFTFKETRMPNSISAMASVTFFRGIGRVYIDNPNSFFKSFILDKVLELSESPFVNPFIVSGRLSNSSQVFHNNNISIFQFRNNRFADIVISPSHKPRPDTREFFKFSLGCPRAFGLEFTNKSISLLSQGFNFITIKFIIRCDCEFINPQVYPKNFAMMVRSFGAFSGECESEIMFFFGLSEQTFNNLPIFKILRSIIRNFNRNFNSALNSGDRENIIFKREGTRSIISDRSSVDKRFVFCFFNHPTRLFNTRNRELRRQSHFSQILINKGVEFDVIPNSHFPSNINTILKSFFVEFNSFQNRIINLQLYWNASNHHCKEQKNINYLNLSEDRQFLPRINSGVSLPEIL